MGRRKKKDIHFQSLASLALFLSHSLACSVGWFKLKRCKLRDTFIATQFGWSVSTHAHRVHSNKKKRIEANTAEKINEPSPKTTRDRLRWMNPCEL